LDQAKCRIRDLERELETVRVFSEKYFHQLLEAIDKNLRLELDIEKLKGECVQYQNSGREHE